MNRRKALALMGQGKMIIHNEDYYIYRLNEKGILEYQCLMAKNDWLVDRTGLVYLTGYSVYKGD